MAVSHVMNIISNAGAVSAGTGSGGGGGGGSSLDTQTITVGTHTENFPGGSGFPAHASQWRGYFDNSYVSNPPEGSASDGSSNLYSGAQVVELFYTWNNVYSIAYLGLRIDGGSLANSGWTTLTVGTTAYQRTAANYNGSSSGDTMWTWTPSLADLDGSYNPFSANGTTTTCVFT